MEPQPNSDPGERGQSKTYKMRTMAGDLARLAEDPASLSRSEASGESRRAAQKVGAPPANIPVPAPSVGGRTLPPPPAPPSARSAAPSLPSPQPPPAASQTRPEPSQVRPAAPGRGPASTRLGEAGPASTRLGEAGEPRPDLGPRREPVSLESLEALAGPVSRETSKPPLELPVSAPKEAPPKLAPAEEKHRRKLFLLAGAAGLIILVLIFEVWWFFIRPSGPEAPVTAPEELFPAPEATLPSQPEPPAPPVAEVAPRVLLSYAQTETAATDQPTAAAIAAAVKAGVSKTYPENSLILLKLLTKEGGQQRIVSLDELANALKITINPTVRSELTGEYNLFLFSRNPFDRSSCERAGLTGADCSGPRLGLVLVTKDGTASKTALTAWEPNMAQNLQALILAQTTIGSGPFSLNDATYKNVPIRYRNFPIDTMTIDYALQGGLLLITTSKSSMFSAIDALLTP